jgi:hypothetical protein
MTFGCEPPPRKREPPESAAGVSEGTPQRERIQRGIEPPLRWPLTTRRTADLAGSRKGIARQHIDTRWIV